jgi:hypothetical protein
MTRWRYQDHIGLWREGTYQAFHATQGTDVTYYLRRDDGKLDLVSGERLKTMSRIQEETSE